MKSKLHDLLASSRVIPLIEAQDAATGVAIADAFESAGMQLVEVVQRTPASLDSLRAIAGAKANLIVGAGTVLSADQARECIASGAQFVVSPGLDEAVVEAAREASVHVIPGIMTPSEAQRAHNLGLAVVKFFPASIAGGIAALQALASVFRNLQFVPTGGISASNLAEYLALKSVLACGGSWMTPRDAIQDRDYQRVTELARTALAIAAQA